MKYLLFFLLLLNDIALACEAMNYMAFQERLKNEPATQLVFFASWCASCKKHMTSEYLQTSYFIASFDDQAAAQKAFTAFLGESQLKRCVFDQDGSIAAAYGVKALPKVLSLKP